METQRLLGTTKKRKRRWGRRRRRQRRKERQRFKEKLVNRMLGYSLLGEILGAVPETIVRKSIEIMKRATSPAPR